MINILESGWLFKFTEPVSLFLIPILIKSTIIIILAYLLVRIVKGMSSSTRHIIWTFTLVSIILLPILSITLPKWQIINYPEFMSYPVKKTVPEKSISSSGRDDVRKNTNTVTDAPSAISGTKKNTSEKEKSLNLPPANEKSDSPHVFSLRFWLLSGLVIWLTGSLFILIHQLIGRMIIWRITLQSEDVLDQSIINLHNTLKIGANIRRPVKLLRSDKTKIPMSWGIANPKILLPAETDKWDQNQLKYVLLHELAHVKRFDSLTQVLAQLAYALFWFNPFVWLAHRQFILEREHACDDYVLMGGSKPSEYASLLLDIARSLIPVRFTSLSTVTMARKSQIEGRLISILNPKSNRQPLQKFGILFMGLIVLFLTFSLATVGTVTSKEGTTDDNSNNDEIVKKTEHNIIPVISAESVPEPVITKTPETTHVAEVKRTKVETKTKVATKTKVKNIERLKTREIRRSKRHTGNGRYPDYVIEALSEALNDPEVEVRLEAIETLGEIGDSRVVETLCNALNDDDIRVRKSAIYALGDIEDPAAVKPLSKFIKDENSEIRKAVVNALDDIDDKEAVEPLQQALSDQNWEIRKNAANALGDIGDVSAIPALSKAIHDENREVRKTVVWALGKIEQQKAVEPLISALNDNDWEVRKYAASALGEIEDATAVNPLTNLLQDGHWEVRKAAASALGDISDPAAVKALANAIKDSHHDVRKTVIWALGEIEDPAAVEALGKAIDDENQEVRKMAVSALGEIGDPRAVKPLIQALSDNNPEIRKKAVWALGEIGDPEAVDALIKRMQDENREVRLKVIWALGEIQDIKALPSLLTALQDTDWEIRKKAAWALGELGESRAIEALTKALKDENNEVRKQAAKSLGNLKW